MKKDRIIRHCEEQRPASDVEVDSTIMCYIMFV